MFLACRSELMIVAVSYLEIALLDKMLNEEQIALQVEKESSDM